MTLQRPTPLPPPSLPLLSSQQPDSAWMNPTIAGRQRGGGFKSSPQKSIISHHHTFRDMNSGPPSARKIYCSNTSLLGLAPSMIFLSKHAAWISSSLNSNFGSNRNRQQCKAISRYAMMTGNQEIHTYSIWTQLLYTTTTYNVWPTTMLGNTLQIIILTWIWTQFHQGNVWIIYDI